MIVFPANPGKDGTRHNFSRAVLQKTTILCQLDFKEKFKADIAQLIINNQKIIVLVPKVFMNHSGEPVQKASAFFKLNADDILVVHDDLELEFGSLAVKKGGGLGGHNGLRSIKEKLSSSAFWRLRLGIGRPKRGSVSSFVLGKFTEEEQILLPRILEKASAILDEQLSKGFKPLKEHQSF